MALLAKTDTHFENILASYLNEGSVKLSAFETEMKLRIKTSFSLLLNFNSREQAASLLQQQFDISQATAYRDIGRALRIYGDINKASKEGMRYIIFEYNQKLLQLATKEKNLDAMGRALDRMIKLAELDKEENLVNLDKLANLDISINISKGSEKQLKAMSKKGVVDLNNWESQDAEWEEVKEENDED